MQLFQKANSERVIWQGQQPHGQQLLGRGKLTFGVAGCVVTAIAQAMRILGVKAGCTPLEVQASGLLAKDCWAKNSSSVNIPNLISAQKSLKYGVDLDGPNKVADIAKLKYQLVQCLNAGGVALLQVDHDRKKKGGDTVGDHWTCAYAVNVSTDELFITDSATAKHEILSFEKMAGDVFWGQHKKEYVATRLITIFIS
jgi:hypothetical protein